MPNELMNDSVAERRRAEIEDPNPTGEKVSWPAWYYGPDGRAEIFKSAEEVPSGWEDHPSKVKAPKGKGAAKEPVVTDDPYKDLSDGDIMKKLDDAKVDYKTDWPRDKLVALLKANDEKKG